MARAGFRQRDSRGLRQCTVSDGGPPRKKLPGAVRGGMQAAVASCLETSVRLAERELAESIWDQEPVESNRPGHSASAVAGGGESGDFQQCDHDVCIGDSGAGARSSAAALAQREDTMAEACLQAVCDAGDYRRRWRACRRRAAALEAELCVALQADAVCVSTCGQHTQHRPVSKLSS